MSTTKIEPLKRIHSPLLLKRLGSERPADFAPIEALVTEAFANYFGRNREKAKHPHFRLETFITELLFAASRRANFIFFVGMPTLDDVDREVPVSLAMPFKILLSSLKTVEPRVAGVNGTIALNDVALFEEVINSGTYRHYGQAQESLQDCRVNMRSAVSNIQHQSRVLAAENPRWIVTKRAALGVLPVTSKIVDAVFGKLPGALAEFSTHLFEKWLSDRRRLVIYDFGDLLTLTMASRCHDLQRAMENNVPVSNLRGQTT